MNPCNKCCVCEMKYGDTSQSFHIFPKLPERRHKWVEFARKSNHDPAWEPGPYSRLCSNHFLATDYERSSQNDVRNLKIRNVLTRQAIPTVFNPNQRSGSNVLSTVPTFSTQLSTAAQTSAISLLQSNDGNQMATTDMTSEETNANVLSSKETAVRKYELCALKSAAACMAVELQNSERTVLACQQSAQEKEDELKKEIARLRKENEKERVKFAAQMAVHEKHSQNFRKLVDERENELKVAQKEIRKLKRSVMSKKKIMKQKELFDEMRKKLAPVLTPNQIDLIAGRKKQVRWTKDELETAFTVRFFGIGQYNFLRCQLKYPLPSLTTLRRYAAHLNLKTGLLTDVIKMMKLAAADGSSNIGVTVISFDEMRVNDKYEYDLKDDEIIGPYKYLQVVMARGLFSKWKSPIYVGFDVNVTRLLLNEVISSLHQASYEVVACVSDMGAANQGLWKELGVSSSQTYFVNPVNNNKIWVFADPPHLLKLTRNWLLDSGKNPSIALESRPNTIDRSDDKFVTTTVFEKAVDTIDIEDILDKKPKIHSKPETSPPPSASTSLLTVTPPCINLPNIVDDGLEYALGFIARNYHRKQARRTGGVKVNTFGDFSYKSNRWDHDYCSGGSYVCQLSQGGLTVPNNQFLDEGRCLLIKMKDLHGDTFKFKKRVVGDTIAHLDQLSTLPKELLASLVKCFIKFRVERLNRETRAATRKLGYERRAKSAAKMRKIV